MVRELADSHHKHKAGNIEEVFSLMVDIVGYVAVSVLTGVLCLNVLGPAI